LAKATLHPLRMKCYVRLSVTRIDDRSCTLAGDIELS